MRASAVWTCVCVPRTAVTRPSSQCASATFSLVASAWTSTTITSACARASSTSPSINSNMSVAGERKSEPMTLITATFWPSAATATVEPAARRGRGEVRGPDDALGARQVRVDLLPPPGVIAERDHVRAGGEEPLGELRRDPHAVGDVLAVQDAEADAVLLPQVAQARLDGVAAGRADHVSDEEDPQRVTESRAWPPDAPRASRCSRRPGCGGRVPGTGPSRGRAACRSWSGRTRRRRRR